MVDSLARIGGEERKCHIGKEANHKDCAYDVSYGFRDFREQIVERRSDEIHEKTSHYAEQQDSDEADSSVQIKEHIAVIPPLFVVHSSRKKLVAYSTTEQTPQIIKNVRIGFLSHRRRKIIAAMAPVP